jgi:hypothetical protein
MKDICFVCGKYRVVHDFTGICKNRKCIEDQIAVMEDEIRDLTEEIDDLKTWMDRKAMS